MFSSRPSDYRNGFIINAYLFHVHYMRKRRTKCTLWRTYLWSGRHNESQLFTRACHRWRRSFTSLHQVI